MRPGITGVWQVTGNNAVRDFEEVVKLDCNTSTIGRWDSI